MSPAKKKTGKHLFIDTNVLLGFYAFSNDDLTELEKLVKILETKAVKLYMTQQVVDEFYRNRDAKLSESFETFKLQGNHSCPRFMTSLPEYDEFKEALNRYKDARRALMENARAQAEARVLLADKLFKRIVEQSEVIQISDEVFEAADRRSRLGNPPGKSHPKLGDELNWEILLAKVPEGTDLHIITKDGDYVSKLTPGLPKVFLSDEWKRVKSGQLFLYEQIGLFFKANFPEEDFSLEIEKRESIDALLNSSNFASTHAAVAALSPYIDFLTEEEAEEVIQGALSNSQVAWIASDFDVESFLKRMLSVHELALSPTQRRRLKDALGDDADDKLSGNTVSITSVSDDDIPF